MNCVGKDNISDFLGMLLSLSVVLSYGAYLAYVLLSQELQKSATSRFNEPGRSQHWSTGLTWSQYASFWSWALALDVHVGGVGLLALLTAPLAWTMFSYHIYLVWAGTTTNESSKWSEWRESIDRGLVYKWIGDTDSISETRADPSVEPFVQWPIDSNQRLFRSADGQHPDARASQSPRAATADLGMPSGWKPVSGLHDIENLYDLGFWENLKDAFRPV
ncbi:MAG: hypothetical protein Q9196_005994 [Gyalolechia fulgens]